MLEELPSKNVSVRLVTSVPSIRTNSTDLKVLKQKGLKGTPLFLTITFPPLLVLDALYQLSFIWCCPVCRSSGEEGELWTPDKGCPPQQVLDC